MHGMPSRIFGRWRLYQGEITYDGTDILDLTDASSVEVLNPTLFGHKPGWPLNVNHSAHCLLLALVAIAIIACLHSLAANEQHALVCECLEISSSFRCHYNAVMLALSFRIYGL